MIDAILDLDKTLFLALNFDGGPFWDQFFWIVTGKLIWAPLYVLIIWLLYRRYGLRDTAIAFVFIIIVIAASDQICNFFKHYVPKPRPSHNEEFVGIIHTVNNYFGGNFGTVSAHTAISFGITTFSSLMMRSRIYTVLMVLWALLVAYSRIYLGVHYPLDVFFGIITGVCLSLIMYKLYRLTLESLKKDARPIV